MPRRRFDNETLEALKAKALELRGKGLTYRKIAEKLGISLYMVWKLLKQNGQRKNGDLEAKVKAEIDKEIERLKSLRKEIDQFKAKIEELKIAGKLRTQVFPCEHIDENGYCTFIKLAYKPQGITVKPIKTLDPETKKEITAYQVKVTDHPTICVTCPLYTLTILKKYMENRVKL